METRAWHHRYICLLITTDAHKHTPAVFSTTHRKVVAYFPSILLLGILKSTQGKEDMYWHYSDHRGGKKKLIQCFVFFLWKKPNYLPREFEFNWGNKWQTSGNRWADFNLKCCLLFQEMCLMSQLDVLLFKECGGWSLFFRVFPKPKTTRAKVKGLDSVVWLTVPTSATVVGMFSKLA